MASPLPWAVKLTGARFGDEAGAFIVDAQGNNVASLMSESNARLAVDAVNTQAGLIISMSFFLPSLVSPPEEVGRCSCGTIFYSMEAAMEHEHPEEGPGR